MRISDWSSDVCSSDLSGRAAGTTENRYASPSGTTSRPVAADAGSTARRSAAGRAVRGNRRRPTAASADRENSAASGRKAARDDRASARSRPRRSEEQTSELQSLLRISYAVLCLKKKKKRK